MVQRRIPVWVRHAPAPGVRSFATLAAIEATARAALISVFPLAMYRAFQDAALVSQAYFIVGFISLFVGLMVPWLTRIVPRRWMYSFGACLYIVSAACGIQGTPELVATALLLFTVATVTVFVCVNAYVLDYIAQAELGQCETLRMFYSSLAWCIGPIGGVWLMQWWFPAPFLISAGAAICLLCVFWYMRLGDGKLISKARAPTPNPFAFLPRFLAQPRLVGGWLFAVLRSSAWWVYVVYVPIFAVQSGMGEQVGGIMLSITNAMLFTTPLMLRWMQKRSVRYAVRLGFVSSGVLFVLATFTAGWPTATLAILMLSSAPLILLDICGQLPFLMSVKPSERTEMSAVYASYRDVSGILSPGAAWLVLLVSPLSGIFAAAGAGLLTAWMIAGRLHPRLGQKRMPVPQGEVVDDNSPTATLRT